MKPKVIIGVIVLSQGLSVALERMAVNGSDGGNFCSHLSLHVASLHHFKLSVSIYTNDLKASLPSCELVLWNGCLAER